MSSQQLQIFTGKQRRDAGIQRAVAHANAVDRDWETMAYEFFTNVFLVHHKGEFQCEQARLAAEGVVPKPPSLRSWGGIITRARNAGLITKVGVKSVKNPKAQMAFAAVWKRVK
jgi:hypothetical protein